MLSCKTHQSFGSCESKVFQPALMWLVLQQDQRTEVLVANR